ncbi:MAG: hypothetical protein ACFFD1_12925 [Candidatus Thorarchaeota archaeon]
MGKNHKGGFLRISISHGSIFQKERISRPWNCYSFCEREKPSFESKKESEVDNELTISL